MLHRSLTDNACEIVSGRVRVGGTVREIVQGRTLVDGKYCDILFGTPLKEIPQFASVYIRENGVPTEFVVATHGYESGLNGLGRTLLVRKYLHSTLVELDYVDENDYYKNSSVDNWFNNDYKNSLDADVQDAIVRGTENGHGTKFKYESPHYSNNDSGMKELQRAVFTLSPTEYGVVEKLWEGKNDPNPLVHDAGSEIVGIRDYLKFGIPEEDYANVCWSRCSTLGGELAGITKASGAIPDLRDMVSGQRRGAENYTRPVFTLPDDTLFTPDTNFHEFIM